MALRPDADVTVGGWRNESGGTTLYASLNETSSNDATYIQSADNPSSSDYFEVGLSNPTGTPTNGPFKYRIFKKLNNAAVVNMKVALMQGSTEIASWRHDDISNTPTEYSQTLTGPQFSAITDFTDLRIRGIPNPPPDGVTYAAGSAASIRNDASAALTLTGLSFPNPTSGRVCGVGISHKQAGWSISGVTIGGVTATKHIDSGASGIITSIWSAIIAAGTSMDVVVTVDIGSATYNVLVVESFTITGASGNAPSSTNSQAYQAAPNTVTVTVPTGGVGVGMVGRDDVSTGVTWTAGTGDLYLTTDNSSGPVAATAGSLGHVSTAGSQALTANIGGFSAMVGAAWGP